MEQKFINWLVTEHKKTTIAPIDYLLLLGTLAAGVFLRLSVWSAPLENAPYQNSMLSMQIVTLLFDVLVAVMLGILVHKLTSHKILAFLAYGIGMLLPVMAAGSAMWAMGDSVYLFFVLMSMYLLLSDEKYFVYSLVFYGMAVFFNLYALFLFPVYIWCFWQQKTGENRILGFVSPVLGVILHMLMDKGVNAAFVLFREEGKLMAAREAVSLSYHFPNLYQVIGADVYIHEYGTAFRYLVMGAVLIVTVLGIRLIKEMTQEKVIGLSLILSIAIPWFLPFMDERAGLLAAIISLLYGFMNLKQFYIPIIQVTITYLASAAYFRGESFLPLCGIALIQLGVLLYLIAVQSHENVR
jgi:hypothetical protein